MEIVIETNFLTQEEFDAVNQIKINAGVRQHLALMREAQKEEKSMAQTVGETQPKQKRKYTPRKKRRKQTRLVPKDIRDVFNLKLDGKSNAQIARKTGLKNKTVSGLVYRLKYNPSQTMIKVLGKRQLRNLA